MTDGYGNSRVVKFDRNGNFIKSWGTYGSGPGEFMLPHSVVIEKNDRVYVGDRENARIQIFDTHGHFSPIAISDHRQVRVAASR